MAAKGIMCIKAQRHDISAWQWRKIEICRINIRWREHGSVVVKWRGGWRRKIMAYRNDESVNAKRPWRRIIGAGGGNKERKAWHQAAAAA